MTPHGKFHWNELMTRNVEGAKAFYGKALGWTFEEFPMPDGGVYWVAMTPTGPAGGLFAMDGTEFEGMPERWFCYIATDDVDAAVAAASAAGAEIVRPVFEVPMVGRIAMLHDTGGAGIGFMTPAPMPEQAD